MGSHILVTCARDGEQFARDIHRRLEIDEHATCWRDLLDLERGEGFEQALDAGMAAARWVVIILTPGALKSEWTAKAWRQARKRGVPICPLWCRSAKDLGTALDDRRLPAGMQPGDIYTGFPAGDEISSPASEAWRSLVMMLRVEKAAARVPFMAPPLPPDYVYRGLEEDAIKSSLRSGRGTPQAAITTVLRGVSGMGTSVLAQAVAHSDRVVDTFYDGVLWIPLGPTPNLTAIIGDVCRVLSGDDLRFSQLTAAASHLRAQLENRHCLVIVDDVWNSSDLEPFIGLGPSVATMATTRFAAVAAMAPAGGRIHVNGMTEVQATRMLLAAVPAGHTRRLAPRCRALANRLGRWPLLLRLAAGQLRTLFDSGEAGEEAFDWIDANRRAGGVIATLIEGSLTLLKDTEMRDAFVGLGVFPANVAIPLATANRRWRVRDPTGTALALAHLSLIELQLGESPAIRLHELIRNDAARRLPDQGGGARGRGDLVDAWTVAVPGYDYTCRWVGYHLKEAGNEDCLIQLLFDYEAMHKRLRSRSVGIHQLIADYGLIGKDGRVYCAWLKGGRPTLVVQHEGAVRELVLTGDGRVVTAGEDGRVYCARLAGGKPTLLVAHGRWGGAQLALTGDGRVVTGGQDGRVYCLRLEGGQPALVAQLEVGISALTLAGDGRVVTGGQDGRVYCAWLEGGRPTLVAQHDESVSALALTGDGRVVTGGWDGRVYCARLEGRGTTRLVEHQRAVQELALTGDGRVVSVGGDGCVYGARLEGGELTLLAQHRGRVGHLALTGDSRIVTGGGDGRVYCARLEGGAPTLLAQHEGAVRKLALTGDGRIVTGGEDGRVYCTRLEGGAPTLLAGHKGLVGQLALTGDGRLVTGGEDGRVYCARLEGGEPRLLVRHKGWVKQLALTGDGRVVTLSLYRVYCSPLDGGKPTLLARYKSWAYTEWADTLMLTGDGRVVISGKGGRVSCVRLEGGRPTLVAQHEAEVPHLALTGDGRIVTGGEDGRVYCARLDGGTPTLLARHKGEIKQLALTGDGRVVTLGSDGQLYCARLEGGDPTSLAQHVKQLAMTDGGQVVTGGGDGRVYCAHLEGGEPTLLAQHEGAVQQFLLIGGVWVISTGADGALVVTDLRTGKHHGFFIADFGFTYVVYDPIARVIVAADNSGSIHILPLHGR